MLANRVSCTDLTILIGYQGISLLKRGYWESKVFNICTGIMQNFILKSFQQSCNKRYIIVATKVLHLSPLKFTKKFDIEWHHIVIVMRLIVIWNNSMLIDDRLLSTVVVRQTFWCSAYQKFGREMSVRIFRCEIVCEINDYSLDCWW